MSLSKVDQLVLTTVSHAVNDAESILDKVRQAGLLDCALFENTDAEYQLLTALRALQYLRGIVSAV